MAQRFTFNPFTGNFDYIDDDVQDVSGAPNTGVPGTIYVDTTDPTHSYYFVGSHRYQLTATLDDPVLTGGIIPLWFTLLPQ